MYKGTVCTLLKTKKKKLWCHQVGGFNVYKWLACQWKNLYAMEINKQILSSFYGM